MYYKLFKRSAPSSGVQHSYSLHITLVQCTLLLCTAHYTCEEHTTLVYYTLHTCMHTTLVYYTVHECTAHYMSALHTALAQLPVPLPVSGRDHDCPLDPTSGLDRAQQSWHVLEGTYGWGRLNKAPLTRPESAVAQPPVPVW